MARKPNISKSKSVGLATAAALRPSSPAAVPVNKQAQAAQDRDATPKTIVPYAKSMHLIQMLEVASESMPKGANVRVARSGKPFSTAPPSTLDRIDLSSLQAPGQNKGRYLLLRVVSRLWLRGDLVTLVGQDPKGDTVLVDLIGPPLTMASSVDELHTVVPVGTCFIVREPVVHIRKANMPFVDVFSPTDVLWVADEKTELPGIVWKSPAVDITGRPSEPTIEHARFLAGMSVRKNWMLAAERVLCDNLRRAPSEVGLLLDRALIRREMYFWRTALQDARSVLALDRSACSESRRQSALLSAGHSAYALQLWGEAQSSFRQVLAASPLTSGQSSEDEDSLERVIELPIDPFEAKDGLDRIAERLVEAKTGKYDWAELYGASRADPHVDLADFTSSAIRVADLKGKGRGIVANRDIKAGELLIMSKPLASVYWDDLNERERVLRPSNLHIDRQESITEAVLTDKIMLKLLDDPSLAGVLGLLYAGPTYPIPPCFSISKLKPKGASTSSVPVDLDVSRVELVRTLNAFRPHPLHSLLAGNAPASDDSSSNSDSEDGDHEPSALYILPSLFNHSCVPNSFHGFLGDAIFFRPTRDLKSNEEITINYIPEDAADLDTRKSLLQRRGIQQCDCRLCIEDSKSTPEQHQQRRGVGSGPLPTPEVDAQANPSAREAHFHALVKQEAKLSAAYPTEHDLNLRPEVFPYRQAIALSAFTLAEASSDVKKWLTQSLKWIQRALDCVGGGVLLGLLLKAGRDDTHSAAADAASMVAGWIAANQLYAWHEPCIDLYMLASTCLVGLGSSIAGVEAVRLAARELDRIIVGGGPELFARRWDN